MNRSGFVVELVVGLMSIRIGVIMGKMVIWVRVILGIVFVGLLVLG